MNPEYLERLDELRHRVGFPFVITSGFRSVNHSAEINKAQPGTHTQGIAADIRVTNGADRMKLVHEALEMGFGGIGIGNGFIHIDDRETTPVMWTYYS